MIYYVSDTHFAHANIIEYCSRPFVHVDAMNDLMMRYLRQVDEDGHRIIHGGDLCFGRGHEDWLLKLKPLRGTDHVIVLGNHDHGAKKEKFRRKYREWFGTIVGTRQDWEENHFVVDDLLWGKPVKVLVSHKPQRDLRGCDLNCYGHVHNNLVRGWTQQEEADYLARTGREDPDKWALGSRVHLNICVEVLDYMPCTLDDVVKKNRAFSAWK